MKAKKQLAVGILAVIATVAIRSRIYGILRRAFPQKIWHFISPDRLVGDIPFGFDIEFIGTRFRLQGAFRHAVCDYYIQCLTQGAYEFPVTTHITRVVRECASPRVLDVGAHYGWYTMYLAKLIANRGDVFAVEPSESVFSFLKQNVESNDLHNVHLYKLPLSDKREAIRMVPSNITPNESRYMYSVEEWEKMNNYTSTINAIPFDELNEMEAINPNIVKIDVHGVWRKVVDGMRESLRKDVKHLYLALDPPFNDLSSLHTDIQHVILMLRDAGMDVYEILDFTKRDGGKIIKADKNRISATASRGRPTMLYAFKSRNR